MPAPVRKGCHDQRTNIAIDLLSDFYNDIRLALGLSSHEAVACFGQMLGHKAGCNDAQIELDLHYKEAVDRGEVEAHKNTLLANFDMAYNEHRAIHERAECLTKPKPGIV